MVQEVNNLFVSPTFVVKNKNFIANLMKGEKRKQIYIYLSIYLFIYMHIHVHNTNDDEEKKKKKIGKKYLSIMEETPK